ncbi:hypothetical protein NE237_009923 [Protea cynaroides]|uniref:Glycosyltransferase 61 catalytic domain-containing protein n=1 Tax=Protea cynaroides TaxID=273540 RepID=A0A9Q0KYL1_9MAGN|nr:hypothetical protein NE237_009923 [Protea cynaroides]
MVKHHRYHQPRKGEEDDRGYYPNFVLDWGTTGYNKRTKRKLLPLFLLFSLLSCSLIFVPQLFSYSETLSFLYSLQLGNDGTITDDRAEPFSSSTSNEGLVCDRRAFRYDTCSMRGDIRILASSSSVINYLPPPFLFLDKNGGLPGEAEELQHEKIKPYTRKWETSVMDTVHELQLIVKKNHLNHHHKCDVRHSVPAVIFSTGGYTGNVYHEFNDGIIPLYITSQHFKKKVVFVVSEYHYWWYGKYWDILSHLSDYPPIDFKGDPRTHCFPEAIIGLKIHDELTVNSSFMPGNESIRDFRNLLDKAYWPRIRSQIQEEETEAQFDLESRLVLSPSSILPLEEVVQGSKKWKPKLVIISREGSRAISNEAAMVKLAEEIGFQVDILRPDSSTLLANMYSVLNSSDAMIGVHGAALTHLLFMRPGTVFIQVIPLGTDWAAQNYYGEPALKLGLKYIAYKILPIESSLYYKYDKNDPVLTDPESVNAKGWQFTKKTYLEGQNIQLKLRRFRKQLDRAYEYTIAQRTRKHHQNPQ